MSSAPYSLPHFFPQSELYADNLPMMFLILQILKPSKISFSVNGRCSSRTAVKIHQNILVSMILQDHRWLSGCIFRVKNTTVGFLVRLSRRLLELVNYFIEPAKTMCLMFFNNKASRNHQHTNKKSNCSTKYSSHDSIPLKLHVFKDLVNGY
jgi:hypothetical protein